MSRLPPVMPCFTDPVMNRAIQKLLLTAFLSLSAFSVGGCRTEDELIGRPWNTPKSWESGLPSAMTEGR